MTLDQLIDTFVSSHRSDWFVMHCWGGGSGPSYRNRFEFNQVFNGQPNVLLHSAHGMTASYKPDLQITIAWGLEHDTDDDTKITDEWTQKFPDKSGAKLRFLDFFYSSALVLRVLYANVDGGRCVLPVPTGAGTGAWNVESRYAEVVRKLDEVRGDTNFEQYMSNSGIQTTDEEWPGNQA